MDGILASLAEGMNHVMRCHIEYPWHCYGTDFWGADDITLIEVLMGWFAKRLSFQHVILFCLTIFMRVTLLKNNNHYNI